MNKKIFFLFIVFIFNSFSLFSKDQSEKLQNKKLTIYQNNFGFLELSGTVSTDEGFVDIRLPTTILEKTILVESLNKTKIKNIKILDLVSEEKTYVLNKQEFLLANIGNKISIEVIEGSETINYEGEILPMSQKTEVLLLQNETALMMIPIEQIAHVSVSGNGKFTKDKVIPQKNLRIKFENPNAQENIKISMVLAEISGEIQYDIFLEEKTILVKSQAVIKNNALDFLNIDIQLININYFKDLENVPDYKEYDAAQSNVPKGSIKNLGKQDLYKNELNIYHLFESQQTGNSIHEIMIFGKLIGSSENFKIQNNTNEHWFWGKCFLHQNKVKYLKDDNFYLPMDSIKYFTIHSSSLKVSQNSFWKNKNIVVKNKDVKTENDNRKKRTDNLEIPSEKTIQQKIYTLEITIENFKNKPQFYQVEHYLPDPEDYFYSLKSIELNNSPVEIPEHKLYIHGNISANKKSVFTYKFVYEKSE